MSSRLRFTQTGPEAGDCTAPYRVDIGEECRTITELLKAILTERSDEWGYIYLMEVCESWLDVPRIEYKEGEVLSTPQDTSWKNRRIECVTASGGWSRMDYYVRFAAKDEGTKADYEATKEPAGSERRDNEEEKRDETVARGEIVNALIEKVSLSMEDHGVLCYYLTLKMNGMGCNYGGRVIGKGYLGAKDFEGYAKGTEAIMRIMDVVGVHRWEDLKGKYVRVDLPDWGGSVERIGNIIEDKWFDQKEFFQDA